MTSPDAQGAGPNVSIATFVDALTAVQVGGSMGRLCRCRCRGRSRGQGRGQGRGHRRHRSCQKTCSCSPKHACPSMTSPMTSPPLAVTTTYIIWPPPAITTLGGPRVAVGPREGAGLWRARAPWGGVVLLTQVLPGGGGPEPGTPLKRQKVWGEPLVLGVSQLLLGALQCALGAALLVALRDPFGAQLGLPLGAGAAVMVSGAVLVAMAQRPSVRRARVALALGIVASIGSFVALGVEGVLMPHGCLTCPFLGPAAQEALLGAHALLLTSAAAAAALAVTGSVAAARGRKRAREGPPIVIYQTSLPAPGAGLSEATPPSGSAPQ
ncbi:uncharacterized protein LOC115603215 [Strigops habroptila]|uniref:uncharacterized protein LOC115603215 n=1 Tax=Strigops habroptila TaxID=2489341 RepID=UPI0011CF0601|nr:uncharacterized protein LOC115603215 [Strigops habroptila]